MPDQIYYAGPNGAGYGIKVLLNLLWFIYATGTAEVLALSSKLGIDLRLLQKALCASPSQSNFLEFDINSVFEFGNYDDGFTLDLSVKIFSWGSNSVSEPASISPLPNLSSACTRLR